MKDLHQLIDKWEARFFDTMAETLDEKIEGIAKQVRSDVFWAKIRGRWSASFLVLLMWPVGALRLGIGALGAMEWMRLRLNFV